MEMFGLKETVVQMAKANGVRWYGYVLRRHDEHVLRKALEFEDVEDAGGEGEQECWFGGGCHESSEMESWSWRGCCQSGVNLATSIYGDKPDQNWID